MEGGGNEDFKEGKRKRETKGGNYTYPQRNETQTWRMRKGKRTRMRMRMKMIRGGGKRMQETDRKEKWRKMSKSKHSRSL